VIEKRMTNKVIGKRKEEGDREEGDREEGDKEEGRRLKRWFEFVACGLLSEQGKLPFHAIFMISHVPDQFWN